LQLNPFIITNTVKNNTLIVITYCYKAKLIKLQSSCFNGAGLSPSAGLSLKQLILKKLNVQTSHGICDNALGQDIYLNLKVKIILEKLILID